MTRAQMAISMKERAYLVIQRAKVHLPAVNISISGVVVVVVVVSMWEFITEEGVKCQRRVTGGNME